MLWTEVYVSILLSNGHKIDFDPKSWDGDESKILIDGMPLPQFKQEKIPNITEFIKDHYVMITRLFDNRVKSFIKNLILKMDPNIQFFWYRIEFQVRGKYKLYLDDKYILYLPLIFSRNASRPWSSLVQPCSLRVFKR